jgi:hypothetical protein
MVLRNPAMIETKHPTELLSTFDDSDCRFGTIAGLDQPVVDALVILSLPKTPTALMSRAQAALLILIKVSLSRHDRRDDPTNEHSSSTLRKLYATPWNPWTLVETLDNKLGAISRKALKWRPDALPS